MSDPTDKECDSFEDLMEEYRQLTAHRNELVGTKIQEIFEVSSLSLDNYQKHLEIKVICAKNKIAIQQVTTKIDRVLGQMVDLTYEHQ